MVFWFDIDPSQIETVPLTKDRTRFKYKGGPLRFQIPRGQCQWGVSSYKSFQVGISDPDFTQWWRQLEAQLCPAVETFSSNLRGESLRLKIDESVYIFDKNSKQINPEVKEGLFRGQEVSCLIDVDSTYFFNGNWGLTIRTYQVKMLTEEIDETPSEPTCDFSLPKGTCAFLS